MITCRIHLRGDLAELARGRTMLLRRLPAPTSVKDTLEAVNIPHGEVGEVVLDGDAASLDDLVAGDAEVEVWPVAARELADPRFVCDLHLGKLARLLRYCGFDTVWDPATREPALARLAASEGRTVLSRHRALLKRSLVTRSLLVRSDHADRQLAEVLHRFQLAGRISRPGRCPTCNGSLAAVTKRDVPVPIPPRTAAWLDDYWLCRDCGQLFWDGTHVERLRARIAEAVRLASRMATPADGRSRSADT